MAQDKFTPTPHSALDPVSRSLNEFYLELNPENEKDYVGIKLHLLRPDVVPDVNFFVKRGTSYRKFRDRKDKFTPFELENLVKAGIERLFTTKEESPLVRDYLESYLTTPPHNQHIPIEAQVGLLRSHSIKLTEDIFEDPSPKNIRKGMKVVSNFINVLVRDPKSFYYLSSLSSHDPYTYQHSVGVGLNSIALAKKLGFNSEEDLLDIGVAGLLHDIGKTKVDPKIINKPGKLDRTEWAVMVQHSDWSYDIVKDNTDLNERVKLAMRHHHEDMDGNGYPSQMPGPEISKFARIVSIADIFNALTTDRTYSQAMSPFEALKMMQDKMSHKFDHDYFKNLILIYGGDME